MKTLIFLDLDDTLADTTTYASEHFNVKAFSIHNKWKILINIKSIFTVWKKIQNNPTFWENIPLKKDAQLIFEKSNIITDEIHILTALPSLFFKKNTDEFNRAAKAKMKWVSNHFPNIPKENIHIVYSHEKHLFIRDDVRCILVDDSPKNIQNWNKAGGTSILISKYSDYLNQLDALKF